MSWTAEAFGELIDPFRRELLVHCYRMLGSIDDAEDAVQEALARAWRHRSTFTRAISFRAWLYRIATNAALDAIERRTRARAGGQGEVGPFPDRLLVETAPAESGPEARVDARESISLAFLTMLQVLPPRQRAVLLLRDVLALRATEVAALLELTVPAVNSALQRARTTMRATYHPPAERRGPSPDLRPLLDRYVRAWEAADIDGLVGLLSDDAVLTMPPRSSVAGAEAIGAFLAEAIFVGPPMRLLETEANGGPAFAAYGRSSAGDPLEGFAILVLATDGRRVTGMSAFRDPGLIARFGLPTVLPD